MQLPAHGGTGLGLSDSAVTESMNAGRFDGDLLGIGDIITADQFWNTKCFYKDFLCTFGFDKFVKASQSELWNRTGAPEIANENKRQPEPEPEPFGHKIWNRTVTRTT